jgi:hypothetical protein
MPPGIYFFSLRPNNCGSGTIDIDVFHDEGLCDSIACVGCIPDFGPDTGTYILNAWAHEDGADWDAINYASPKIILTPYDAFAQVIPGYTVAAVTEGAIIDGWQRIEKPFVVPPGTVTLKVELIATGADVYYDDIRIFPADGSMKCYVYDPVNLRFVAELDERHYATFYEYDGEGKLARVKKETERGIMTIQETRYNSSKLSGQ